MFALRSALVLAFGTLLFLGPVGEAHAATYAYVDPCQALGVACPAGGVMTTPGTPVVPETPEYVPPPLLEVPVYVPPPVHSAAPLPRTGMDGMLSLLLLSLGVTLCWTQSFRLL